MRVLKLPKTFDTVCDSGFTHLVVSGCSFTYNYSDEYKISWPYVLSDKLNIPTVLDCSMSAVGNLHISRSTQWCLETSNLDPNKTLVVVMWSGNGREECITDTKFTSSDPTDFYFTGNVVTGRLTQDGSLSNVKNYISENFKSIRTYESAAVESYLNINSLFNYLNNNKYNFVFLDFMDRSLPNRSNDFILKDYLPKILHENVDSMFPDIENFYRYSLKTLLLNDDDFHPSPQAHEQWCDKFLVPYIIKKFDK